MVDFIKELSGKAQAAFGADTLCVKSKSSDIPEIDMSGLNVTDRKLRL